MSLPIRFMLPVELRDQRLKDIWNAANRVHGDLMADRRFAQWRMRNVRTQLKVIENAVLSLARDMDRADVHPVISGEVLSGYSDGQEPSTSATLARAEPRPPQP